ncbi:MAG TPA: heavy metal translocating P-type ATPase [Patescibacteria group bacterium]
MKLSIIFSEFRIPILVAFGIILYIFLWYFKLTTLSLIVGIVSIIVGSYELFLDTFHDLFKKHFALDYIAILAIVVALVTKEYLVGMVIALMIASGQNLENYGVNSAKRSLTKLIDRIPREIFIWENGQAQQKVKIEKIQKGQAILIRKGEVIPLDGVLISKNALVDESSLTGEPYPVDKIESDTIHSGTINVGEPLVLRVENEAKDSTYRKIIALVEKAQTEKAPLIRLADKYSTIFTIITFIIAGFAYFLHPGLESILAVLVVATPCPLIIATPIALLGGVNAAAKRRIIIKKLSSLEVLSKVTNIIFDKTGTITIGKPTVVEFKILSKEYSPISLLGISEAIERHSLHPLAKAIVEYAKSKKSPISQAENIKEVIGKGISGVVNNKSYTLSKFQEKDSLGMAIGLYQSSKHLATFIFEDEIKQDSKEIVMELEKSGISLSLFTGDKKEAAEKVAAKLDGDIFVKAECSPEDKQKGIEHLKKQGKITAMVGDGINDAPALALSDVGMVFSNEEQTAASEAADIVFLGGTFKAVEESLFIAQRTIGIAMQSILWGIGLSILAMILASFGLIPPIFGAILQEGIDVAVILNALRATR